MKPRFTGLLAALVMLFSAVYQSASAQTPANETTVNVFRLFGKELLDSNAIPFMQPLVTSINATSNARFFNQARIPKENKFYFRFGVHAMVGFVRDDQRTFTPRLPLSPNPTKALQHVNLQTGAIGDTAALINELLKYVLYKADQQDSLDLPADAATIFGRLDRSIPFNKGLLQRIVEEDDLFKLLSPAAQETVRQAFANLPAETRFALPPGQDMNYLVAAVPQLEIGSLYGTELLIRYIPLAEIDTSIGHFSFWGLGLKHSISQYFEEWPFDAAIQMVYQRTNLENSIGVTGAALKAKGSIINVNLHASKHFEDIIDIYTGFSYENLRIESEYTYVLPKEIQDALQIVDNSPQTSNPVFKDKNYKFILGLARQVGPIAIFADYSISKFNIFSGGIEYRF